MPKLILIKHAAPEVVPSIPSHEWRLSERGRQSCTALAQQLARHPLDAIVSSTEPKAVETAEIIAQQLNLPHHTVLDLHEHDRSNVPHMPSAEFISSMELVFRRPGQLVLGQETAEQALSRFESALDDVLRQHANRNVAVVSHGTVIALFLAKYTEQPAYQLWRRLQLPSFAVLSLPELALVELVERVTGG